MKALRILLKTNNHTAPLIARLKLDLVMFPHGAQKVFGGHGFSGTMGFFTGTMQIPSAFAFFAIMAEFAGSLGRIVGFLFSRVAAFGIASVMAIAILMVHATTG